VLAGGFALLHPILGKASCDSTGVLGEVVT
jgi:hypothetical protein